MHMSMDFRTLVLLLIVAGLLVGGCTADAPEHGIMIEERDGVAYVSHTEVEVWNDLEEAPLQFELVQTFGAEETPDEALLSRPSSLTTDDAGNVYLYDVGDDRLLSFDPDGRLRWSAGASGQGPGEFQNVLGDPVWDGSDRLYLSNQFGARLDAWSTDGAFDTSFSLEDGGATRLQTLGIYDDTVVLAALRYGAGDILVTRFDPVEEAVVDTFGLAVTLDPAPFFPGPATDLTLDGHRLFASPLKSANHLFEFAMDGTAVREVHVEADEHLVGAGTYTGAEGMRQLILSDVWAPLRIGDGRYIRFSYWTLGVSNADDYVRQLVQGTIQRSDSQRAAALDVLNDEGHVLGRFQWDDMAALDMGAPVASDADGHLYTTVRLPYPQVRKYAVTVAP